MITTVLLAAMVSLILLLMGAVYSAMIISHKTEEIIRGKEDPTRVYTRRGRVSSHRNALGNA